MTEGSCPACGAPISFTAGSAQVLVCTHCHTVVARKDASLEARGKVAQIVDTDSPLQLGVRGSLEGKPFRIVGHLQKDHGAGPWDEWYLELDNERGAWLSEAEGAWSVQRFVETRPDLRPDDLRPNQALTLGGTRFVVEERGRARVVAAAGELPEDVDPSRATSYIDLTGPKGAIATLDFASGGGAEVFVGRFVERADLQLDEQAPRPRTRQVPLQDARCPQCNGPLELKAPDLTRRVACPYCGALSEVTKGKLAFLALLDKPSLEPVIPLGRRGTWKGVEWVCIAFLVRSCTVEGTRYPWTEYLLFHPAGGFRWLMESNGHWVFLTPIPAGEVVLQGRQARYRGEAYRRFGQVEAVTEYVLGECYWEVSAGERALATEYVAPPRSLNLDETTDEVTYTLGEYLEPSAVKALFELKSVPPRHGVAPSQPNPFRPRVVPAFAWAAVYAGVVLALFGVLLFLSARQAVVASDVEVPAGATSGSAEAMFFTAPFELKQRGNLRVRLRAPRLEQDWLGLSGDLVNQRTQEVTGFYVELSRYSGVADGEAWSEGSAEDTAFLSALPPGEYVLRVTPQFDAPREGRRYQLELMSDVPRLLWVLLAWGVLLVWPLGLAVRSSVFESTRWSESSGG